MVAQTLPKWWVLGLGLLAIGQATYNFRPRIEIVSAIPLDEHDPFATVFLIQNSGPCRVALRFGSLTVTITYLLIIINVIYYAPVPRMAVLFKRAYYRFFGGFALALAFALRLPIFISE